MPWFNSREKQERAAELDARIHAVHAGAESPFGSIVASSPGDPKAAATAYYKEIWARGPSGGLHSYYRQWHDERLAEAAATAGVTVDALTRSLVGLLMEEIDEQYMKVAASRSRKEREQASFVALNYWRRNGQFISRYGDAQTLARCNQMGLTARNL